MNSNFSLWQGETCTLVKLFLITNNYGSHKGKNNKQPLHFLSPMCKMYSKSVYYFNDITLSWIWKIFFLDKTHLYWFSDYLLFLLTVYKYSINSWSVGQQLGNNFNKHKKGFTFGDITSFRWKRRISGSQTQKHN